MSGDFDQAIAEGATHVRVGTALFVAIECGHPKACFLGDVYHTYKGGSDFNGLKLLGPQALQDEAAEQRWARRVDRARWPGGVTRVEGPGQAGRARPASGLVPWPATRGRSTTSMV